MLSGLSKVTSLSGLWSRLTTIDINTTLPVEIKVAKKLDHTRYTLQLGSRELETKSFKNLEVGKSYWGELETGKGGVINLNNLKQKPKFLDKNFEFKLEAQKIFDELSKEGGEGKLKAHFLKIASESENVSEFKFYMNMALGMNEGKIVLPLTLEGKELFAQIRERKNRDKNDDLMQKSVEFYAVFSNLGPIDGTITLRDNEKFLNINVMYDSARELLEEQREDLEFSFDIGVKKDIEPLFEINDKLLDISV